MWNKVEWIGPTNSNNYEDYEVHMGVSKYRGTPKSSILIGFSIINHPFWGISIFGNTHKDINKAMQLCIGSQFCRRSVQRRLSKNFKIVRQAVQMRWIHGWQYPGRWAPSYQWSQSKITQKIAKNKRVSLGFNWPPFLWSYGSPYWNNWLTLGAPGFQVLRIGTEVWSIHGLPWEHMKASSCMVYLTWIMESLESFQTFRWSESLPSIG